MKKAKPNKNNPPVQDESTNVTREEKDLLKQAANPQDAEDLDVQSAALDSLDDDDDALNEGGDLLDMGQDLDVPGSEEDDEEEILGEEDEENNSYSQSDN